MARSRLLLRLWIAIVSVAVVAMPVSGAHLHLCFDGNEPAAAVHAVEDGHHHAGEGATPSHHDVDVSLTSSALAKKLDRSLDLPPLLTAALLVLWTPGEPVGVVSPEFTATPLPESPLAITPPARGPPV